MSKNLQEWITEGEEIYSDLLCQHRELESQLEDLEHLLSAKQVEVNRIAAIIGKPPIETNRRLSAQLVSVSTSNTDVVDSYGNTTEATNNIARALNGRLGR